MSQYCRRFLRARRDSRLSNLYREASSRTRCSSFVKYPGQKTNPGGHPSLILDSDRSVFLRPSKDTVFHRELFVMAAPVKEGRAVSHVVDTIIDAAVLILVAYDFIGYSTCGLELLWYTTMIFQASRNSKKVCLSPSDSSPVHHEISFKVRMRLLAEVCKQPSREQRREV